MDIDPNKLLELFDMSVADLKRALDQRIERNHLPGKIVPGRWSTDILIVGSVSYFHTEDASEDTLDFVYEFNRNSSTFTSDICTSSGDVIQQIVEKHIESNSDIDAIKLLQEYFSETNKAFISWFDEHHDRYVYR